MVFVALVWILFMLVCLRKSGSVLSLPFPLDFVSHGCLYKVKNMFFISQMYIQIRNVYSCIGPIYYKEKIKCIFHLLQKSLQINSNCGSTLLLVFRRQYCLTINTYRQEYVMFSFYEIILTTYNYFLYRTLHSSRLIVNKTDAVSVDTPFSIIYRFKEYC